jgi:ABC-2 type transport system ATP-binding protein
MLGLTDKRDAPFAKLSGGQRQRLSIALALVGRPEVAVLDELTTGLDPQARRDTWNLIETVRDQGVTVLLVTHFMEEAERLCDRVALLDRGRVVRIDTPAAMAAGVGAPQRIRFRPSGPVDLARLRALPEVAEASRRGDRLAVAGTGDLVGAVTTLLVCDGVVPHDLRVAQTTLEDAFVALTGHGAHNSIREEHR